MREIVAAGAHRRRAPKVEHDALRPVAVVLRVARQNLVGRAPPDLPGVAGWGRRADRWRRDCARSAIRRGGRAPARRPVRARRSGRRAHATARAIRQRRRAATRSLRVSRAPASRSSPAAKPSALSGERPNTCRPSPTRMSLRSQSQASRATSASSGDLPSAAHSLSNPRLAPSLQDERGDGARAARIERLRLGEFVEQPFELERRAVRPGGDQRRRQMADRRRADAALGLRRLAGIVDDERDRRRASGRARLRARSSR